MGSTTYEWILDHEYSGKDVAEWKWMYDVPCWVFTHRQLPVVPDAAIEFVSGDVAPVHESCSRPPVTGTSGSSAGEIWPVSSPTLGCWTR